MRVVLDTNVAIAGLLWRGPSFGLLGLAMQGKLQCFSSAPLIGELERVLTYTKFAARIRELDATPKRLADDYSRFMYLVTIADLAPVISKDRDDDLLLATALAAGADAIVSGDVHVLNLKRYQNIDMVTPAQALARVESK